MLRKLMIFDIRNPLHILRLMIGRAQTRWAWRLPLSDSPPYLIRACGEDCCSEELKILTGGLCLVVTEAPEHVVEAGAVVSIVYMVGLN